MNYSELRDEGMELIAKLAGSTWSDHNAHDPGISILEAYSYAMTDIAFRTQLEMADLISSSDKNYPHETIASEQVLKCALVFLNDMRKVILDHYLVNDASITLNIDNEIPIYKDQLSDPPISYTPGEDKIKLSGLYEVLLEFNNADWNSNSYTLQIDVADTIYSLDIALPFWDDQDAILFHNEVTLHNVALEEIDSIVWHALEEDQTFFAKAIVQYSLLTSDVVEF